MCNNDLFVIFFNPFKKQKKEEKKVEFIMKLLNGK